MTSRFAPRRDETGASLLFVIGFLVMVSMVTVGLVPALSSSWTRKVAYDNGRNREYAADGAIETAIATVRVRMRNGQAPCPSSPLTQTLNGVSVQVDCSYSQSPSLLGFIQRNATFTACPTLSGGAACSTQPTKLILQAQVNFASTDAFSDTTIDVDKTYVQFWSVKS
jgi:hypothetical protein